MKPSTVLVVRFVVGALSLAYLLNMGAGIIELIPDNLPYVGNVDEAAASVLVDQLLFFGMPSTIVASIFGLHRK